MMSAFTGMATVQDLSPSQMHYCVWDVILCHCEPTRLHPRPGKALVVISWARTNEPVTNRQRTFGRLGPVLGVSCGGYVRSCDFMLIKHNTKITLAVCIIPSRVARMNPTDKYSNINRVINKALTMKTIQSS
jgi:hypothetical protein